MITQTKNDKQVALQDKVTQMYIDNQYEFSKFVLTISEPTKLQSSSMSMSLFDDHERIYIRNRLKALTQISEIIQNEEVKKETIEYFIEDLFNLSILSRTKKAWLIKQIFAYASGNKAEADNDLPKELRDDSNMTDKSKFSAKSSEL